MAQLREIGSPLRDVERGDRGRDDCVLVALGGLEQAHDRARLRLAMSIHEHQPLSASLTGAQRL